MSNNDVLFIKKDVVILVKMWLKMLRYIRFQYNKYSIPAKKLKSFVYLIKLF